MSLAHNTNNTLMVLLAKSQFMPDKKFMFTTQCSSSVWKKDRMQLADGYFEGTSWKSANPGIQLSHIHEIKLVTVSELLITASSVTWQHPWGPKTAFSHMSQMLQTLQNYIQPSHMDNLKKGQVSERGTQHIQMRQCDIASFMLCPKPNCPVFI